MGSSGTSAGGGCTLRHHNGKSEMGVERSIPGTVRLSQRWRLVASLARAREEGIIGAGSRSGTMKGLKHTSCKVVMCVMWISRPA